MLSKAQFKSRTKKLQADQMAFSDIALVLVFGRMSAEFNIGLN